MSEAIATVDIVEGARGSLECLEARSYNAENDIVHILSFYHPGCGPTNCGALALAAFTNSDNPKSCSQNDAFDGAPPPTVFHSGITDEQFTACLTVLDEVAEQKCP